MKYVIYTEGGYWWDMVLNALPDASRLDLDKLDKELTWYTDEVEMNRDEFLLFWLATTESREIVSGDRSMPPPLGRGHRIRIYIVDSKMSQPNIALGEYNKPSEWFGI